MESFGNLSMSVKTLSWYLFAKNYIRLFGEDNVLVLPYELLVDDHVLFIRKVMDFVGMNKPPPFSTMNNQANQNCSVRLKYMYMLLFLNYSLSISGMGPIRHLFRHIISGPLKKSRFYFLKKMADKISIHNCQKFIVGNVFYNRTNYLVLNLPLTSPFMNKEMGAQIIDIHKENNIKLEKLIGIGLKKYKYY
tara:strand:- start:98 stop:673 length:576 start_codon:yes stop_codon:yes gene_type:complete